MAERAKKLNPARRSVNLALDGHKAESVGMEIPIIQFDAQQASSAYLAHIALIECELRDPSLRNNAAWTILRQDAFQRFANAYEAV